MKSTHDKHTPSAARFLAFLELESISGLEFRAVSYSDAELCCVSYCACLYLYTLETLLGGRPITMVVNSSLGGTGSQERRRWVGDVSGVGFV
jgi:hypothetical protein